MFFRYNHDIQYICQDSNCVKFLVNNVTNYLKINKDLQFDYSLLTGPCPEEKIPDKVRQILQSNKYIQYVDKDFQIDSKLGFFKKISSTQIEIDQRVQNLFERNLFIFDISKSEITFPDLLGIANVLYITDLSAIELPKIRVPQSFILVITDSTRNPMLATINQYCIENSMPWMLVSIDNLILQIGPFFSNRPTQFCFNCYANAPRLNPILPWQNSNLRFATQDIQIQTLIGFLQFELLLGLSDCLNKFETSIKIFDPASNRLEIKNFLPYPICNICKK